MLMISKSHVFFVSLFIHISASSAIQLILVNKLGPRSSVGLGLPRAVAAHPTATKRAGSHLPPSSGNLSSTSPRVERPESAARRKCCCLATTKARAPATLATESGQLHCNGIGGTPPSTIVEMTFGTSQSPYHFYDVSLVDGFNVPVSMSPVEGGVGCGVAQCEVNLNVCCPSKFEVKSKGKVVGCQSACMALKSDKYCCTGEFGSPSSCKPTLFSHLFKAICPQAYSFAYDDSSSLKRCKARRYLITFCPPKK
ncbi:uncharacterized protein A4U43_C08F35480 [Asparagus officinalis]|nr:uncharacterized protein A4U43_C08F35480 [Asparagus officinalis]